MKFPKLIKTIYPVFRNETTESDESDTTYITYLRTQLGALRARSAKDSELPVLAHEASIRRCTSANSSKSAMLAAPLS